jgi:hypothetical protein
VYAGRCVRGGGRLRLGQDLVDLGEVRAQPGVFVPELPDDRLLHVVGGEGVPTLIEEVDGKLLLGCHADVPVDGRMEGIIAMRTRDLIRNR